MKRPRGSERQQDVVALRAEVPWVRHAWELGRRRRRVEADLKALLAGTAHSWVEPLRAGDPRVARAQLDRHLQERLRKQGQYDDQGLIFGGVTRIAHRPFETESIDAIRNAYRALDDAFMRAKFSSSLERSAFAHAPKHARDDEGAATEEQWHDAWLQITWFQCSKSVAYEAIGISKKAYEARRRRPREKANGLSINDEEALESLNELIAKERESIENHERHRAYVAAIAGERGLKLPKKLRMPRYSKALRGQMPKDWRFLDDDRARWIARLSKQPRKLQSTWRTLIQVREERIAGAMAALWIFDWFEENLKKPSSRNNS